MKTILVLSITTLLLLCNLYAQSEEYICKSLFSSSSEITQLSTDAISLGVDAVWAASGITGYKTTTGTLTQNGQQWSYSAVPNDKLVLVFSSGTVVEYIFYTIQGYEGGDEEDFKWSHQMDFNTYIANNINLRIYSNTNPQGGKVYWQRTIKGATVYDQQVMNVDLTHNGNIEYDIGNGFAFYTYREQAGGTTSSAGLSVTVNESYTRFIGNNSNASTFVMNTAIRNNSSANISGTTYAYQNAYVFWAAGSVIYGGYYDRVIDANDWLASGSLLKNGQQYGTVQFDGPVINGTYGPNLILHLNSGTNVLLHTLIEILTGVEDEQKITIPGDFILHQNYPNPFNPSTSITYKTGGGGIISIKVYDILGREIEVLVPEKETSEGIYQLTWEAKNLPGGVYFCRMEGSFPNRKYITQTVKMILLK